MCQLVLFLLCNLFWWPSSDHIAVTFSRSRPVIGIALKILKVSLEFASRNSRKPDYYLALHNHSAMNSVSNSVYLPAKTPRMLRVWQESKLFACAALQYALWSRRVVKSSRLTEHDPFHAGNQWRSRVGQPESARGKIQPGFSIFYPSVACSALQWDVVFLSSPPPSRSLFWNSEQPNSLLGCFSATTLKAAGRKEASDLSPQRVLAALSADASLAEAQVSSRSQQHGANEINRMLWRERWKTRTRAHTSHSEARSADLKWWVR